MGQAKVDRSSSTFHQGARNAANIDRTAGTSLDLKDGDIGETKSASVDHEVGESSYIQPKAPRFSASNYHPTVPQLSKLSSLP
jgi:hypothetical protein